ncbi:hypothetical protein C9374_006356 [Naegleria lovaniensis]|uniref:Translocon-associated protein subunit beta n=1 Tax=Naegleria lovaniensis TaxID=51637 RepID=A0AA88GN77_NAELO|nr:uncharacterized protein C9374_006356 [Naegleria lovaniensis]KAG2381367.1 hypothetical protein C9374_006356 [Naegleria lovaniensis]
MIKSSSIKFSLAFLLSALLVLCVSSLVVLAQDDTTTTTTTTSSTEPTTSTTQQQHNVRLLLHKSVSPAEAIINTNMTFTITLFNLGEEPAYDVEVKDNEWPESSFDLIEGESKATFAKIGSNEKVSFTYTIVPKSVGEISTQHATASYRLTPEKDEKSGLKLFAKSNILPSIPVLTQADYDRKHDSHLATWATFFLLALIPTALPYAVYMNANNQILELADQSKKNQ